MFDPEKRPSVENYLRIRKALMGSARQAAMSGRVGLCPNRQVRFHTIVGDQETGKYFGGDVYINCPAFRKDGTLVLNSSLSSLGMLRDGYLLAAVSSVCKRDPEAVVVVNEKIIAIGAEVLRTPVLHLFADFISRTRR